MSCLVLTAVFLSGASLEPEAPFGFRGLEIFRASQESAGLCAADLNGDGLTDLVYADNADATLRFLLQAAPGSHPEEAPKPAAGKKRSVNEIKSDSRFREERFYTEKKVTSLAVADLDGDGKLDLAYYGDPKELEVVYQAGEWGSKREKFPITDGSEGLEALSAADLDGDGRSDLVLLAAGKTYLVRQRPGGGLEKPQVIYNAYVDADSALVGDLDGDRKPDLVYLRPRASHPFLIRFQRQGGFGPELAVKSLPVHRARLESLQGAERADVLAIQGNTRRIRALRWGKPKEPPGPPLGEPRLYAFRPEGDPSLRRVHLGDLNGDGRADLAVSSAETAELDIYLQNSRGEFSPPSPSPTLAEVKGVTSGDLDGDGAPETVVVSAREKAIGVSRWVPAAGGAGSGGRLSIPESHAVDGEPLLAAAGPGGAGGGRAEIAVVSKGPDGKFRLSIHALRREGAGAPPPESPRGALALLAEASFEAGAEPSGLVLFDASGDGLTDALVSVPFEDPRLFVREAEAGAPAGARFRFREASRGKDFGIGQIARLTPAAYTVVEPRFASQGNRGDPAPRGRALLVAQKSFARALTLEAGDRLRVVEQFAGRGAAAEIAGAAALDLDGDPEKEVLLFDRAASAIDILDSTQGVYRLARSISMPAFEFSGFTILDLSGDGREDAAVLGKGALAVLYQGGEEGDLEEFARYDLDDRWLKVGDQKGLPDDLAVGDLNGDGARDVVFSTEPLYFLGFLTPESGKSGGLLQTRLTFPVFEEKSYMRRQGGHGPREIVARDITGDGKTDLVLMIHDRILLYPQE